MSNASNTAESCSCPACNGAPEEADRGAFVCQVVDAARKENTRRYFHGIRIATDRHALREARKMRVAATRVDYWTDSAIADFTARAEATIAGVLSRRAARLAVVA